MFSLATTDFHQLEKIRGKETCSALLLFCRHTKNHPRHAGPDYAMGIMGTGPGAHAHLGPKQGEEKNLGVSLG